MEFKLKSEYIALDNLLKAANIVSSGAQAKDIILSGVVKVNGIVETRIRRKLRLADVVNIMEQEIKLRG